MAQYRTLDGRMITVPPAYSGNYCNYEKHMRESAAMAAKAQRKIEKRRASDAEAKYRAMVPICCVFCNSGSTRSGCGNVCPVCRDSDTVCNDCWSNAHIAYNQPRQFTRPYHAACKSCAAVAASAPVADSTSL